MDYTPIQKGASESPVTPSTERGWGGRQSEVGRLEQQVPHWKRTRTSEALKILYVFISAKPESSSHVSGLKEKFRWYSLKASKLTCGKVWLGRLEKEPIAGQSGRV